MRQVLVGSMLAILLGCMRAPTVATDSTTLVSPLGFRIEVADYEGVVTPTHAELADRWWTELLLDLRASGYSEAQTNPQKNAEWVFIYLYRPRDSDHMIQCPGHADLVGACFDQFKPAFRVPGTYADASMLGRRPASQALKHEMLHHWCFRTLRSLCTVDGYPESAGHVWPAPNNPNTNIWMLTWK